MLWIQRACLQYLDETTRSSPYAARQHQEETKMAWSPQWASLPHISAAITGRIIVTAGESKWAKAWELHKWLYVYYRWSPKSTLLPTVTPYSDGLWQAHSLLCSYMANLLMSLYRYK
jgi:hypothetical protein